MHQYVKEGLLFLLDNGNCSVLLEHCFARYDDASMSLVHSDPLPQSKVLVLDEGELFGSVRELFA